jgi:hypothetical protein
VLACLQYFSKARSARRTIVATCGKMLQLQWIGT